MVLVPGVSHGDILRPSRCLLRRRWVEPDSSVGMGGDESDLVGVAEGEVGIDEDEDVCDGLGDGEHVGESCPRARVGVDDDGKEGRDIVGVVHLVVLRSVDGVLDAHLGRRAAILTVCRAGPRGLQTRGPHLQP